jgi:hypothetical protein
MMETKIVPETLKKIWALLEKQPFMQSMNNFATFYVTRGFRYRVYNSLPQVPILSQTNQIQ